MSSPNLVSGPMNIVRLEGSVNNINKTIYLFMDFHVDPRIQTECNDIRAPHIKKFLFDSLSQSTTQYDLFFELDPLEPFFEPRHHVGKYLHQVAKLFIGAFKFDRATGTVLQSELLPNVRLHFIDVRGYLINSLLNIYNEFRILSWNIWSSGLSYYSILNLKDALTLIDSHFIALYNIIYKSTSLVNPKKNKIMFSTNQKILHNYTKEDYVIISKKIIFKLLKGYKHNHIKNKINSIVKNDLHTQFDSFLTFLRKSIKCLDTLLIHFEPSKNLNLNDVLFKQSDLSYQYGTSDWYNHRRDIMDINHQLYRHIFGGTGLYLMDLYFLRRVLDKDYVTNAVVYTGAHHSLNYIRMLVNTFDFKITHASYIKDNDFKKAHNVIKNSSTEHDLNILFYPPILNQCSDLSSFPDLFH